MKSSDVFYALYYERIPLLPYVAHKLPVGEP